VDRLEVIAEVVETVQLHRGLRGFGDKVWGVTLEDVGGGHAEGGRTRCDTFCCSSEYYAPMGGHCWFAMTTHDVATTQAALVASQVETKQEILESALATLQAQHAKTVQQN
jgi:hypothetical protein